MNKLRLMIIGVLLAAGMSCSSENEDDIQPDPSGNRCEDVSSTLSGDVQSIITSNCATSGCHVSGTGRVDFTDKQNIIEYASTINSYTQSGFMPPSGSGHSLTAGEKDKIFCWVSAGAQDN
ncbi:2-polyprenyl-6-methoxyphenol hydroxylase [Echinicola strongylocentroti]|uniref:2-polyprenyl-6-methoxyphenol hydroxylase n=1 Tax=Echinicola strongylocentroti TaxID=1795355 RepID=A0A2Z4IR01_9BACT|nr:2-polyprenyl-6-methoxyphenol hydroxylase [Echinicola strongylocentroti]AWW33277.1 2-polyprenyl-6-methoxyphenol hydroxylase [Echinicola strongylocentroti]